MSEPALAAWRHDGNFLKFHGHQVFYRSSGNGPTLALLHGFPTSSFDWGRLWPGLSHQFRVSAFDFLGYGYSDKPKDFAYSARVHADQTEFVLSQLGASEVHLLAHDYGDTVAQELLARQQQNLNKITIKSVIFLNGGLFPETHRARLAQRLLLSPLGGLIARMTGQGRFIRSLADLFADETRPATEELDAYWRLLEHNDGRAVLPKLVRYITERRVHRARWVGALQKTDVRLRLICGMADPVSGAHMASRYRALVPHAEVIELAGIGHFPQIEAPDAVLEAVKEFHGAAPQLASAHKTAAHPTTSHGHPKVGMTFSLSKPNAPA